MSFLKKQSVRTRILASLTALVLTTGLAGCSDDDDADLEDTANASDVETEYVPASADGPAQNVPEPSLPAAATENSEEGAEATLQYFWRGIDFVRLTGDPNPVNLVSKDSCDFCEDLSKGWAEIYADDSWAGLKGEAEVEILEVNLFSDGNQQNETTSILFEMTEPAADFYENGQLLEDESFETESTADWWAELTYDGTAQRWKIEWIGLEEHINGAQNE